MKLLSLKCPHCQLDMEGDNNSRVFFCRSCRIGVDFSRGQEREFPLECVAPEIERPDAVRYFAFWVFHCRYRWDPPENAGLDACTAPFWVPAFFIKNISYFGDIGLYYTNRGLAPREERCRRIPAFPADRGETHAAVYPMVYATSREAARQRQVVELTFLSTKLVWVPFYESGHEFVDSLLGWTYPSGALI